MRSKLAVALALLVAISCGSDENGFTPPTTTSTPANDATATALAQTATPEPPDVLFTRFNSRVTGYSPGLTAQIAGSFSIQNNTDSPISARLDLPEGFDFADTENGGSYELEPGEGPVEVEVTGELPVGLATLTFEAFSTGSSGESMGSLSREIEVESPILISEAVWEYAKETQGTETNDITWFRKWEKPELDVFVAGTDESVEFYSQVAEQLSDLTGLTFSEYPSPDGADIIVVVGLTREQLIPLLPEDRREQAERHFETNAAGFDWEFEGETIVNAAAMALGEPYSQSFTNHNILEEFTQVLGPGADSPRYKDSIFYEVEGVSGIVTELSEIDKNVLRFLYDDRVRAGDTFDEVERRVVFVEDIDADLLESLIDDGEPVYAVDEDEAE